MRAKTGRRAADHTAAETPVADLGDSFIARLPSPPTWALVGLLAAALLVQFPYVFQMPFLNDDYILLEQAAGSSFFSLWGTEGLSFYRPWSRALHYWALQLVFGAWEPGFHAVSLVLCVYVLGLYLTLVRRLTNVVTAVIATGGVTVMAAWAVPVLWVAGVQDLWMLLFALLSLHALARHRAGLSALLLIPALLSKETAAAVPFVSLLYTRVISGRGFGATMHATRWHWVVVAVWAALHPMLGGRLWGSLASTPSTETTAVWNPAARTLLSLFNIDRLPAPQSGFGFLALWLPAAVIVVVLVTWVWHGATVGARKGDAKTNVREIALFGSGWALVSWVPLLWPGIVWQSYYGLLGAMGAWMVIATVASKRPLIAIVVLVACSLMRSAQGATPSSEWGSEFYQRRAGAYMKLMRADLLRKHPSWPHHTRLYFTSVPSAVGFITKSAPALRVWYGDSTLSGGLYRSYRQRAAATPMGQDVFFRFDSTLGWVGIDAGEEDVAAAQQANPRWEQDHVELAAVMARAEDWAGVGRQYEKLASAHRDKLEYVLNAGIAYEMLEDSTRAAMWYRRVLDTPGAAPDDARLAREFEDRWMESAEERRRPRSAQRVP